ncbi:unnamed protein product [Staurois parvus]|uniref:Uncharacterized protein n=1 Tax=Staurois parvus TaxID=386267 RepID=A0ABN9D862_9NEOB|nr:unnamed protein product [Staurois parvus]
MTAGLSVETRPLDDTGSTGLWLRLVLPRPLPLLAPKTWPPLTLLCVFNNSVSLSSNSVSLSNSSVSLSNSSVYLSNNSVSLSNNSVSLSNNSVSLSNNFVSLSNNFCVPE